ncbi:MAG: peptidoglycan-binding protein [Pseudomonadota bacterium]
MKPLFLRCCAVLLSVFLVTPQAFAADADGQIAVKGAGIASCERFLKAREERSQDYFMFGGWMEGFITAMNTYEEDTFDLVPWQRSDLLAAITASYCRKNPEKTFYQALVKVANTLGPQRLDARSELILVGENETGKGLPIYSDILMRAQNRLTDLGHDTGGADGQFGPGTKTAILAFQKEMGLKQTGLPDQPTLIKLFLQSETD